MTDQPTIDVVSCKYGAPMGRAEWLGSEPVPKSVRLFRVQLHDGYDVGGAYWGGPNDLFCATDGKDFRRFVRARNRKDAAEKLELTPELLARAH